MRKISNTLRIEELEKLTAFLIESDLKPQVSDENLDLARRLNSLKNELIEYERLKNLENVYSVWFDDVNNELEIFDTINKKEYLISKDFLDNSSYLYENGFECSILIDVEDEIEEIEDLISYQGFTEDKGLMRLNLRISKDNPEKFNLVCNELIRTYEEYKKGKVA